MACFNPENEEYQSVCRVMSGFSDSFYMKGMKIMEMKLQIGSSWSWSRNYAAKDIRFGVEAWALMLKGVEELADAVKGNAGPKREPIQSLIQELPKFSLNDVPTDYSECLICLEEFHVENEVMVGLDGKRLETGSNVLLASIENMQYVVTLDVLHMVVMGSLFRVS